MVYYTADEEDIQKLRSWIGCGFAGQSESQSQSSTLNQRDFAKCKQHHLEGTCKWLFDHPKYERWVNADDAKPVLWLTAAEGRGKSVLCSLAVQHISNKKNTKSAAPYLMLTFKKERSRCQMITLLASQLLDHVLRSDVHGAVDKKALSLLSKDGTNLDNLHELVRLLVRQCPEVYFFVDGLNELYMVDAALSERRKYEFESLHEDLRATLEFLVSLTTESNSTKTRLWCSSQKKEPMVQWMEAFDVEELTLSEVDVQSDVSTYISRIKTNVLERLDESERPLAELLLRTGAESSFRWAAMMADSLKNCKTTEQLRKALNRGLPKDLSSFYQRHLEDMLGLDEIESCGDDDLSLSR
ncbi:hypothetical protein B5807_12090 [Epicoccum nigrum]|uniref:Nephrocystin 3-like N-terminal domain-containing protein n=1 Tax=Epicoccum nigrum TaxID=105696 RepID=A0A1Y2LGW5_EPING|nr:hypothetical protein B5807_12090 [Epicoccum nigrum]